MRSVFWGQWELDGDLAVLPGRATMRREDLQEPGRVAAVLESLFDGAADMRDITGFITLLHQTGALRAWLDARKQAT